MAGRGDIQAGRAFVELFVKDNAYRRGLAFAQARLKAFESGLKQMSEQFTALGQIAAFFGLSVSAAMTAAIARLPATRAELAPLSEAFGSLGAAVSELVVAVAQALTPSLVEFAANATHAVGVIVEFVRQNSQIVVVAAQVIGGITAGGVALIGMAAAFKVTAAAAGILATALGFLSGIPAILIVGGAAAIAFLTNWTNVFASLSEGFAFLHDTAAFALDGIRAAIASGDLAAAAAIAWQGIRVVWLQGVDQVLTVWDGFVTTIRNAFTQASAWIADAFLGTMGLITRAINGAINLLNKIPGIEISNIAEFDAAGAQAALNEDTNRAIQQRLAAQQQRAADRDRAIEEARASLDEQVAEAKSKPPREFDFQRPGATTPEQVTPAAIELPNAPKITDGGTAGTFSAAAALALGGGGGPAERTAKASEDAAKRLAVIDQSIKETNDLLKSQELAFTA